MSLGRLWWQATLGGVTAPDISKELDKGGLVGVGYRGQGEGPGRHGEGAVSCA